MEGKQGGGGEKEETRAVLRNLLLYIFSKTNLSLVYHYWIPPTRVLPPMLWKRIRADLGAYLVERGTSGTPPNLLECNFLLY